MSVASFVNGFAIGSVGVEAILLLYKVKLLYHTCV